MFDEDLAGRQAASEIGMAASTNGYDTNISSLGYQHKYQQNFRMQPHHRERMRTDNYFLSKIFTHLSEYRERSRTAANDVVVPGTSPHSMAYDADKKRIIKWCRSPLPTILPTPRHAFAGTVPSAPLVGIPALSPPAGPRTSL
jgi:hypothetical protein